MTIYTATIANKFFFMNVATSAPDKATAKARFEAYAKSEPVLVCAAAERSQWIEELGEYPGDEAYTYELCDGIEDDGFISGVTDEYLAKIEGNTSGQVFVTKSGGNG